jgi:hypothetical protein
MNPYIFEEELIGFLSKAFEDDSAGVDVLTLSQHFDWCPKVIVVMLRELELRRQVVVSNYETLNPIVRRLTAAGAYN